MFRIINNLFDYFRKWKYVETEFNPRDCFSRNSPLRSEVTLFEKLEKIYEWNYDNLEGEWDHFTREIKKGKLCRSTSRHLFAFKRTSDVVAFKLKWTE